MAERTEPPSPRQLRRAREQGDVPVSSLLTKSAVLFALLLALPDLALATAALFSELLKRALTERALTPDSLVSAVLVLVVPGLASSSAVAIAIGAAQSGGLFAPKRLAPDFGRLSLGRGLRTLLSPARWVALLLALATLGVVCALTWRGLRAGLPELAGQVGETRSALQLGGRNALGLLRAGACALLLFGALDWLRARRAWLGRWSLSREELARERREAEGDPDIKAARRRSQQILLENAAAREVREATLIVTGPAALAAALRFAEQDHAPSVLALGDGALGLNLVRVAHDYAVPVLEDAGVALALRHLEVGDRIPETTYASVAELVRAARLSQATR